ncbi:glycosyltransferase family 2 protein [Lentibacillus persicus]|uniref:glycosyltransferase family 2 protein n=1 Tax=Lentibacillus persicus TaxID=640948 RepID=UPI001C434626|nr:glycosyltransferase family 2 protein [Lentibacillus persicus]
MSKVKKNAVRRNEYYPNISVLVSAYNEEKHIEEKINNLLGLVYPKEKLQVIIGSDGSTDRTSAIVKKYHKNGIQLYDQKHNTGKITLQKNMVEQSTGDIIVFSDATSLFSADALKHLAKNFYDEKVGAVVGELRYAARDTETSEGQGFYWNYETFIRKMESNVNSVMGASGSMYAMRKKLYTQPKDEAINEDFVQPISVINSGYRAVYETDAVAYEEPTDNTGDEFSMRVRVVTRGFRGISYMLKEFVNVRKKPFTIMQLFSHKLLRWLSVVLLIGLLATNIILLPENGLYALSLFLQLLFYVLVIMGYVTIKMGTNIKLLTIPFYFFVTIFASFIGMIKYLKGEKKSTWTPLR